MHLYLRLLLMRRRWLWFFFERPGVVPLVYYAQLYSCSGHLHCMQSSRSIVHRHEKKITHQQTCCSLSEMLAVTRKQFDVLIKPQDRGTAKNRSWTAASGFSAALPIRSTTYNALQCCPPRALSSRLKSLRTRTAMVFWHANRHEALNCCVGYN